MHPFFPVFRRSGLLLMLALGVVAATRAAEPSRTLVFFGDSLTAGYGLDDPATESYPARIREKVSAAVPGWRVVNAGLSGETTAGGLRRVDWILRQPVDVFVLALGANDGLRGVDPALSQKNLEEILARVRAKYPQAKLVLAGMQMPPSMGADYATKFAAVFAGVAKKYDATLIPFLLDQVGGVAELNQSDQIHPNVRGHQRVAETVWAVLKPLL